MGTVIKLTGLFLFFLACTSGGCLMAVGLKQREKALRMALDGFAELERRIRCDMSERDRLLQDAFRGKKLLNESGTLLPECGLFPADREIVTEFLTGFGSGNITAEENRIRMTVETLERQYDAARNRLAKTGRLWVTAGICAGLFGCIIFI